MGLNIRQIKIKSNSSDRITIKIHSTKTQDLPSILFSIYRAVRSERGKAI